ncbi:S8 family serine peptidase [Streptacidiphilus sp. PB12-B1b]|uniref:S8 family serine peptidase n=1 Tax=Streptacidiphilus sp. PB12-B1b TaxID=2705012 RepID=UPI0015F7C069|nr:S8 family serine peptidase [Streptacidiphilus sp. PB12-B1b]QMU78105.1 S8 family serine peptidase [Streptacidiphilus sp. PB12-B1b]
MGVSVLTATAVAFGATPAAVAAPGVAAGSAAGASRQVIVVLADQHQGLPDTTALRAARAAAVSASQAPVIKALHAAGAQDIHPMSVLDAVAATVSTQEQAALRSAPGVAEVVPDAAVRVVDQPAPPVAPAATGADPSGPRAAAGLPSGACAPSGGVQLDPEAIEAIHADSDDPHQHTARSLGATGKGVIVGDIAGSIDVNTPELIRADGSHVIADYKDFTGEGGAVESEDLESFLDDGMIAAQSRQVYDLADYTAQPLGHPCLIRLEGVAPQVTLDAYKVYANNDFTTTSAFLEAIDYAVGVDHVNVLNEEAGSFPMPDTSADLIKLANADAMAAGVTVTVPSYDAGPESTIWSPASQPGVISVGASTTFRSYAQSDTAGYRSIGARGWVSDNISSLSSGGSTEQGRSIDVVAPGDLDWAICTADTTIAPDCLNGRGQPTGVYQSGGTSEAGPLVAGVAALVIQAYRATHGGAGPTPQLVDQIISSTADDLGVVGSEQGAGLVDAYRAVEAARSVRTGDAAPKPVGDTLLADTDQLDATGNPGAAARLSLRLTNTGRDPQTVSLAGRTLGAGRTVADRTVTLHDGGPTYQDASGLTHNVARFTFTVPPGADRLDANIANPGTASQQPVDLTLLDPRGRLTGYSLPQGDGNHGHIDLRAPEPGTWTAVVTDFLGSPASGPAGYTGPVSFAAAVSSFHTFGTVTPSRITLAPGASTTVRVTAPLPAQAGDESASLAINSPQSGPSSVPMTLRSVIPVRAGTGTFTGDVVGGNGRGEVPAQTLFYQVNVPAGRPALDVRLALADHATDPFTAYLVSPDGQTPARAGDQVLVGAPGAAQTVISTSAARLHVLAPAAGTWTLIVSFSNPVTGDAQSTRLDGTVGFAPVTARANGVPTGGVLPVGSSHQVRVTVRNDSTAVESYFLDARLDQQATLPLSSFTPSSKLTLPLSVSAPEPQWIVPTGTTQLVATADSTAPVMFDFSPATGEPDLGSTADGDNAYGSYAAPDLTQGDWDIVPQPTGALGAGPAASSVASLGLTATTPAFDPSAVSPSGDLWELGLNPAATFSPVVVQPGHSATLYLDITPSGPAGSTVSGHIYVDDTSSYSQDGYTPTGDQLVALPYHYTVG